MGLDAIRKVANALLETTPDFEASGGHVTSPQGPLKGMPQATVMENIVIFFSPEGNIMKPKGWAMLYFMDTPQAAQMMKQGQIDYPMFVPGSLNMRFGGYAMIDDLWKKHKAPRGEKPESRASREAKKHVVGALEAYILQDRIFVDNLSVRPGWKRNTIGSKLMAALKENWPGLQITHSDATDQGKTFLNKTKQWNPDKELSQQAEMEPVRPTIRQMPATESAVHSILTALLEEEDKPDDWIGVDLDGTLAKYTEWKGATKIGEPIPKMVSRIRRWVGHGKKVKLFTARADDEKSVNAIKKWLKDHELPALEITNLKDQFMTELWDDRAVAVEKNTGEVKEAMDEQAVAWARHLLTHINDGGIWGVPDTGQIFQFNHRKKTITLIEGPANDHLGWMPRLKELFAAFGYKIVTPGEDEIAVIEAVVEHVLNESPQISTLEKHRVDLEPEERAQVMKAKAVWPFGKKGADSPAIHKALLKGRAWYWSSTHRYGHVSPTVKSAIKAFHEIVEPTG